MEKLYMLVMGIFLTGVMMVNNVSTTIEDFKEQQMEQQQEIVETPMPTPTIEPTVMPTPMPTPTPIATSKPQTNTNKTEKAVVNNNTASNNTNSNYNQETIVYITNTGSKYHRAGCSYLRKSKIEISLKNAISRGYTPCSKCF